MRSIPRSFSSIYKKQTIMSRINFLKIHLFSLEIPQKRFQTSPESVFIRTKILDRSVSTSRQALPSALSLIRKRGRDALFRISKLCKKNKGCLFVRCVLNKTDRLLLAISRLHSRGKPEDGRSTHSSYAPPHFGLEKKNEKI
jgi:hypothetical protein